MSTPFVAHRRTYCRVVRRKRLHACFFALPLVYLFAATSAQAQQDLFTLSIEDLANIQVTSVSKKAERLADAAASVFVITHEDLRRSGVASLQEALRLAPNLHVAQVSSSGYAISARGFNSSSANKLLVLIDGRSVYTPLFGGVFWDVQDVVLEDVERIEVISGPGGILWGTNAVNGVINIITRAASATQGTYASVGSGNRQSDVSVRHGATTDSGASYRIYAKNTYRKHSELASGAPVNDAAHLTQAGFRSDWRRAEDRLTVQGDVYAGEAKQPPPGSIAISGVAIPLGPISVAGANLAAHWDHPLADGARLTVQATLERTERTVIPTFAETLDIADLQIQHTLAPRGMHALTWGMGHRYARDQLVNSTYIAFLPANVNQKWLSLFLQDEIALRQQLKLTLGARVERNDYTGWEFLPAARLAWKLKPEHLLWAAVSRTVRAPSRLDHDLFVPGSAPFLLNGGTRVQSELATVSELGYRAQLTPALSYSATLFHTRYTHLRTQELAANRRSVSFASQMQGQTNGIEMWGKLQATTNWRLSAGLSALHVHLTLPPGVIETSGAVTASGRDPAYKLTLRSAFDLSDHSQLDFTLRKLGALSQPVVPGYTALDVRYGWRPDRVWEFSLGAQNLTGAGHGEFASVTTRSELGRMFYLRAVGRF